MAAPTPSRPSGAAATRPRPGVAQRAMERLDAELSEKDDEGRLLTYGKVGVVAVVGNEDGAHKISADLYQCLNDVGFTIPAGGVTY
ncbi:hypothetical protein [Umezawaea sp. NPDC059074]|uniref:hypothetical protein n=1 Tax=Umezawaea sp. NPDC059074 TaxID=3346716 RepID=UPI0036C5EF07